ncbi:forespore capture DNA-binding protein RefZ [Ectobacillus sp. SYSU M60031]|uniref:Forespore capture DNA-binding protein RefZ n=1 Tax=Ectobacillus ponti TaxID=2961894 RepID=A0AA42BNI6_9BACI|nr:forespore capture DNA-binding protein RefZ [Ectobacillus ponti]MCP8967466.1 forespore capture DNA-binding protein RefZ [Ectobacillus ponti]
MKESRTKQSIIDAAITLFNTKGYAGTSVRDIAGRAKVNAANISYYFTNKQGLLEYIVTQFLDGYIRVLEQVLAQHLTSPKETMLLTVRALLRYQSENRYLTRFFYREISLDSVLNRELVPLYLSRERQYFQVLLRTGMESGEFHKVSFSVFMVQLKAMLQAPYLHTQYISEVLYTIPSDPLFLGGYAKEVEKWLEHTLFRTAGLVPS